LGASQSIEFQQNPPKATETLLLFSLKKQTNRNIKTAPNVEEKLLLTTSPRAANKASVIYFSQQGLMLS
jgi:hypothetical protein